MILMTLAGYLCCRKFYSLKSDSHPPKKVFIICVTESPSKVMKNAFLFNLKSSFPSEDI